MDQVEIDRKAIQRVEARLAVSADRLRASVRHPPGSGSRHAALGHDTRLPLRAATPKGVGEQALVVTELILPVPIRVRGVEHGHMRGSGGCDRL